jgi:pimeloyl-ACP methyl ester carboxylesterase
MNIERKTIAGVSVELRRAGAGENLLYLHAGDGAGPSERLIAELARTYSVVAPSHPGFDGSDLPDTFSTVEDLGYFYLDFIEAMGLDDISVVGCSLGAWIAASIAIKSRARIRALALLTPVGAKFDARDERQLADVFYHSLRDARKLLYADGARDERDYAAIPEEAVARVVRNRESFTLLAWSPLLHDPKLRQRLHRLTMPTLVVSSAQDKVAPPAYAKCFADSLPHARLVGLEGAGHYAHDEKPVEAANIVREFLGFGGGG